MRTGPVECVLALHTICTTIQPVSFFNLIYNLEFFSYILHGILTVFDNCMVFYFMYDCIYLFPSDRYLDCLKFFAIINML